MSATIKRYQHQWMILIGVVGAAVLLIISLWVSILSPTGASAAAPVYVRPGGNDSLCNGTVNVDYSIPCAPNCAFRTISKGISDVDTDGIVNVASGEYNESVVLDQVITVTMSGDITVTGNISITAGALNATPGVLALQGDFGHEEDGRFYSKNGTLKFNGSSPQHIQGDWVTSFANVTIDNSTGVYLDFNQSISKQLNQVNGNFYLGAHILELGPNSTILGTCAASRMIVMEKTSELCKTYAFESIPPIDPFLFPIGEISGTVEYSPMSIAFSEGTFPAPPVSVPKVCVKLVNTLHPDNYFPNRIKRYWTLESENITDFKADLSFTYTQADVEGDEADLLVIQKNTTGWDFGDPTNTGTNTLSMTDVATLTTFTGGGNESTITIDSLTASGVEVGIRVDWHTAFESGINGFNLYRADSADPAEKPITPINASLIPSDPGAYVYTDTHPTPLVDQYYWLEVVTGSGGREDFGPVSAIWYFYTIHLPIIRNP